MGTNLQYEGIQEVVKQIGSGNKADETDGPTPEEIQKDWKRLASFMSGIK